MIKYLINLGLVLCPFAVWQGMDTRVPKEIAALGVALSIGLFALYNGSLKKFRNVWLLIFIGFCLFSICRSPDFKRQFLLSYIVGKNVTIIGNRSIAGFWVFRSLLYFIVYLLMAISVASIDWTKKQVHTALSIMAGCGLVTSLLVFLQKANLDQFFYVVDKTINPDIHALTQPAIGGALGQSTLVAAYLVTVIPIALYLRKYLWVAVMAVALYFTESKVAICTFAIVLPLQLLCFPKRISKCIGILLVSIMIFGGSLFIEKTPDIKGYVITNANGRFQAWGEIYQDFINNPVEGVQKHTITGLGPGAFEWLHSIRKDSRWFQAHNEPLEILYNFGFIGLALLFMAVREMFKMIKAYWKFNHFTRDLIIGLTMSLVAVFLTGLGIFSLRITPILFNTVLIIGLLHNQNIVEGNYAKA